MYQHSRRGTHGTPVRDSLELALEGVARQPSTLCAATYKLWPLAILWSNLILPTHLTVCIDLICCCPLRTAYLSCMPSASHHIHSPLVCVLGRMSSCQRRAHSRVIHWDRFSSAPPSIRSCVRWALTLFWAIWTISHWLAPRAWWLSLIHI